ncbi:MAG: sigma-70 family RNA polymerase sigma factor [Planctomycetia bacterium]|nr:sigma-70 family RNA polymerase sigma factor [Planctomycetia bacterium]
MSTQNGEKLADDRENPSGAPCPDRSNIHELTASQRQMWLAEFFQSRREALSRMVAARVDPRLLRRSDLADILQESYLTATRRLDDYLSRRTDSQTWPPAIWLREIVLQTLCEQYRKHFGAGKRDVRREAHSDHVAGKVADGGKGGGMAVNPGDGDFSVGFLMEFLAADQTSPSEAAVRGERREALAEALRQIPAVDREILILRHFEQLDNAEIARLLQISPAAASARYVRAIGRIRGYLKTDSSSGR